MKRIVVVGTGTGVGKTAVSVALLRGAVAGGRAALGLKPIESGVAPEPAGGTDAERLSRAADHSARCLFALRDALSPHLAAEREGRVIQVSDVLAWIDSEERAAAPNTWVVVETAGGLCTPLSLRESNLNLLAGIEASQIALVAPNRLGVLHDVIACVSLLQHSALPPDLIVLTDALGRDPSSATNSRELARLTQRPVYEFTPTVGPDRVAAWFAT